MAAPNAVPGKNLTFTYSGAVLRITESGVDESIGDFDITSTKDGGFYRGGVDILRVDINGTVSVTTADLAAFQVGAEVAASWVVTSGHSYTGNVVITKQSHKAGARGGYMITFSGWFNGSYTAA